MSLHGTAFDEFGLPKHDDRRVDFQAAIGSPIRPTARMVSHGTLIDGGLTDRGTGSFRQPGQGFDRIFHSALKRSMDVLVSAIVLVGLSPLFLVISLLIVLDSRGPVFFAQERWGLRGRRIKVYKFRTMFVEAGDFSGITQTVEGDSRITRLGRFLRRTNIDELPQLLNVLRGDMSLVGPRCHPIGMLGGGVPYEELVPGYHQRHEMKPGITGLAQASGYRGPTVDPEIARKRIELDLAYIQQFSLWLDLKILARTFASEWRGGTGT